MVGPLARIRIMHFLESACFYRASYSLLMISPSAGRTMRNLLVLTDYPIGYSSGFGETLFNMLEMYPGEKLWNAHPLHLKAAPEKKLGQSCPFNAPMRPAAWPEPLAHFYYPILKVQQAKAIRQIFKSLSSLIRREGITALLTCPVNPWLLSVALRLKQDMPDIKLLLFVMDDWEGHHHCFGLPYTRSRRKTLSNLVDLASARFGVSLEMVERYGKEFGVGWQVLHNGIARNGQQNSRLVPTNALRHIRLTGDVNVFRMDAVLSFARGLELYNRTAEVPAQFEISGTISADCYAQLASLPCVTLLPRTDHATCLKAISEADLLYLPMAFSTRVKRIAELSLPTKLPEYLNAGRPIFFHAPERSAVYQFAKRWGLQPRLSNSDPKAVCDELHAFTSNRYEHTSTQLQAGLDAEFDIDLLRQRLCTALA
jgi:hypothetical protein